MPFSARWGGWRVGTCREEKSLDGELMFRWYRADLVYPVSDGWLFSGYLGLGLITYCALGWWLNTYGCSGKFRRSRGELDGWRNVSFSYLFFCGWLYGVYIMVMYFVEALEWWMEILVSSFAMKGGRYLASHIMTLWDEILYHSIGKQLLFVLFNTYTFLEYR